MYVSHLVTIYKGVFILNFNAESQIYRSVMPLTVITDSRFSGFGGGGLLRYFGCHGTGLVGAGLSLSSERELGDGCGIRLPGIGLSYGRGHGGCGIRPAVIGLSLSSGFEHDGYGIRLAVSRLSLTRGRGLVGGCGIRLLDLRLP